MPGAEGVLSPSHGGQQRQLEVAPAPRCGVQDCTCSRISDTRDPARGCHLHFSLKARNTGVPLVPPNHTAAKCGNQR